MWLIEAIQKDCEWGEGQKISYVLPVFSESMLAFRPILTSLGNMRTLLFGLFVTSLVCAHAAEKKQWEEYQNIMTTYSSTAGLPGDHASGEIELLNDPEKVSSAMKKTGRDIGILYQDRYWIWVNDAVQFPNGNIGVYGRILARYSLSGKAGSAVIPRFRDGRIALNCNFRHATRTWELEIPRGIRNESESPEEAARREMLEETGLVAGDVQFLGEMPPDSGQSNTIVQVYLATVEELSSSTPEDSEAIDSIVVLKEDELCQGIKDGFLFLEVNGSQKKVFLRDPFLTYALTQMGIRGLFSYGH